MNISLTTDDAIRGIITLAIEKKDYEKEVDKNLRLYRRKMTLSGYRKGTAPMGMIRKVYGRRVMADEINRLTMESLFNYIRDNKIGVMGEPLPQVDQEPINFDTQEEFVLRFDVALAPKTDLKLSKEDHLKWYDIRVDSALVDKQVDAYRRDQGDYSKEDSAEAGDWIKGKIVELENGEQKPGGVWVENTLLILREIENDEERAKFIGAKQGDSIVFNPKKAFGDNSRGMEMHLHLAPEVAEHFTNDCRFDIIEITRLKPAELTPEFFDRVLGKGKAADEETFRAEIQKLMKSPLNMRSDVQFEHDVREMLINKVGDVPLADDILKRWLELTEKISPEDVEKAYPHFVADLKYHLAKEHFMSENDLKVEDPDIEAMAKRVARSQLIQYGILSPTGDLVDQFVKDLVRDDESRRNLISRASDSKLAEWVKGQITVETVDISLDDYDKLMQQEAANKVAEFAQRNDAEDK